jgi:steroid 5-alpha reductase family enzyme
VITTVLVRIAEAWALAAALQLVLWIVQQRTRNAGIVDVGWALSFALVIGLFVWRASACLCGWTVIAAIVCVWSLRLGGYLLSRGAARSPEEGRYVELRTRWAPHASRRFFVFFQAQAALTAILSSAFVVPFIAEPRDGSGWLRAIGGAIAIVGILGESAADLQLARFKRDPASKGKVCDVGLWAWSRHPNYFFEWCVWVGYAVYGLAFGAWGLIAIVPQAIILASLFGVTGIPPRRRKRSAARATRIATTSGASANSSRYRRSALDLSRRSRDFLFLPRLHPALTEPCCRFCAVPFNVYVTAHAPLRRPPASSAGQSWGVDQVAPLGAAGSLFPDYGWRVATNRAWIPSRPDDK